MADLRERIIIDGIDNTGKAFKSVEKKINLFEQAINRVGTTLAGFVGVVIFVRTIGEMTRLSDVSIELNSKLKLVTDSFDEFKLANDRLYELSQKTGTSLESNTILFTRLNRAVKNNGGTTKDTLEITEALANSLRISGASVQEAASVVRQFSQAQQSGLLRGEEFNAIMENGGRFAFALADGLGVTIGKLRQMSKEGLLTADIVNKAILNQSEQLRKEAEQLPITITKGLQRIQNAFVRYLNAARDTNINVAKGLSFVAENLENILDLITAIVKVGGAIVLVKGFEYALKLFGDLGVKVKEFYAVRESGVKQWLADNKIIQAQTLKEIDLTENLTVKERVRENARRKSILERAGLNEKEYIEKLKLKSIEEQISAIQERSDDKRKKTALERKKEQLDELLNLEKKKIALLEQQVQEDRMLAIQQKSIALSKKRNIEEYKNFIVQNEKYESQLKNEIKLLTIDESKYERIVKEQRLLYQNAKTEQDRQRSLEQLAISEKKLNAIVEERLLLEKSLVIATEKTAYSTKKLAENKSALTTILEKIVVSEFRRSENLKKLKIAQDAYTASVERSTMALSAYNKASFAVGREIKPGEAFYSASTDYKGRSVTNAVNKTTGAFSKLKNTISSIGNIFGNVFSKITNVLFGIPGLIALITYEALDFLDLLPNWEVFFESLKVGFRKIAVYARNIFDSEQRKRELADIDAEFAKFTNNILEKQEALRQGFESVEEMKRQQVLAAQRQIAELETSYKSALEKLSNFNSSAIEQITQDSKRIYENTIKSLEDSYALYEQEYLRRANLTVKSEQELKSLKLKALTEYNENVINTLNDNYNQQFEIAKKSGQQIADITRNHNLKVISIYQNTADALRKQIDEQYQYEKVYADKRLQLEKWLKNFEIEILGDKRKEWQKNLDARKVINEANRKLREAELAEQIGNHEKATKLREEALEQAKEITTELKSRSQQQKLTISEQIEVDNLLKTSIDTVKTAGENLVKSYETLENNSINSRKTLQETLDEYITKINNLDAVISKQRDIVIQFNKQQILDEISTIEQKLEKLTRDRTVNVKIVEKTVQERNKGGLIYRNDGGFIPRSEKVPGAGNSDTVKALLTPGEFVMKKSAVEKYGSGFMKKLNDGVLRFANGGLVDNPLAKQWADELKNTISKDYKTYGKNLKVAWFLKQLYDKRDLITPERINEPSDVSKFKKSYQVLFNLSLMNDRLRTASDVSFLKKTLERIGVFMNTDFSFLKRGKVGKTSYSGNGYDIWRFANGGEVGGNGFIDSVKALLTPGEFVINREAVRKFGVNTMESINAGLMPKRFANGGLVGGSNSQSINVNFNFNGKTATGIFPKDDNTMMFIDELKRVGASA